MYVCIYIYIHIYIHIYIYIYIHNNSGWARWVGRCRRRPLYVYLYVYMHLCMFMFMLCFVYLLLCLLCYFVYHYYYPTLPRELSVKRPPGHRSVGDVLIEALDIIWSPLRKQTLRSSQKGLQALLSEV